MKIGSLFDGSGGFPLAASLCGMEPVWASEVEPYPIAVTKSRFPNMKHLGDIRKINGGDIEPVDAITFGSPCQDLSVAGKRAGLKHEANGDDETTRSGLFMEAVRIIKEMRSATNGKYPRFAIWENVPGAFSSHKGEDFRIVLEELIKIVEPEAEMPAVPGGKWPYADCYVGAGWSLAYRTFDAQYWGVPQRRRRILLVVDFGSERAEEILFERKGLRGYFAESGTPRKSVAGDAENGSGAADREKCIATSAGFKGGNGAKANGIGWQEEIAPTLSAVPSGTNQVPTVCVKEQFLFENHSMDTRYKGPLDVCPMLPAQLGTGGNNTPFVVEQTAYSLQGNTIDRDAKQNGNGISENVAHTLNSVDRHGVVYGIGNGQANQSFSENVVGALNCMHDQQAVVYGIDVRNMNEYSELYPTLQAKPNGGQSLNFSGAVRIRYVVRRLTPIECARLQGFYDGWGFVDPIEDFTEEEYQFWLDVRKTHAAVNGKPVKDYTRKQMLTWYNKLHTDSSEYKMWGNGIALPTVLYVMQGIQDAVERMKQNDSERSETLEKQS